MKRENRKKGSPVWESVKRSLRRHPQLLAWMCLCMIASVVTALLPPLALEKGVDLLSEGEAIPISLAILYLVLIIAADLLESAQGISITILGQKVTQGLRGSLCEKLNALPTEYYYTHDSGKTASLFVNDADTIDSLYSEGIVGMIADCFKIISILAIVLAKSLGLGILLLIVTPFLFALTRLFQKRTLSAQSDNRRAIARVNNHVPETIRNIRMIHVFSKETWMEEKYDSAIGESYEAVNRSNLYDSIYSPIILMTQSIVIAVMMISAAQGAGLQRFFGLSVGSAVAIIAYVGKIFTPLESLGMEIQNIQSAMSGIKRINEFLSEEDWHPAEEPDTAGKQGPAEKRNTSVGPAKSAVLPAEKTAVYFSHVSFGYTKDRRVLSDFSFDIKEGEHVTFMGRTGSGKTTIFRLLTGLYEADGGEVTVDGLAPALLPPARRRKVCGIVEQKFALVPGSVKDQLTLYDPAVTGDMVQAALKLVGLDPLVQGLERGADTPMESAGFSQGQLQLLSIARAVVTSPKILLLDEITANLDSQTEAQVLAALKNAAAGRTVVSISHRWSQAMEGERIISLG